MTIFLWYVFGVTCFTFHMLNYILVVSIHGDHPTLYKELGEPSAFHFLLNRYKYFTHPYSLFIFNRQYRSKLSSSRGLYRLAQGIFGSLIVAILSAVALAVQYA